jgi:hypothetical protein
MHRIGLTIAVLLASSVSIRAEADDPETVELREVRWQFLPDDVGSVRVGPDGRVWLEQTTQFFVTDFESAKAEIEKEFDKQAPRLKGMRPVLFEPGKRIWFRSDPGRRLLAFDGQEWIEKDVGPGLSFTGGSPGLGRSIPEGVNLLVGKHRFFPTTLGVHIFDGESWAWQTLATGSDSFHRPILNLTMDGKGVVALMTQPDPSMWRWRDGQWSRIALEASNVVAACPAPGNTVLVFHQNETVSMIGNDDSKTVTEQVDAGIERLRAATTPEERHVAVTHLQELGVAAVPLAERALATSYDPEFLASLTTAIRGMGQAGATLIGDLTFRKASLLAYDQAQKTAYLHAREIRHRNKFIDDGLVVVHPDGSTEASTVPAATWQRLANGSVTPISAPEGAWLCFTDPSSSRLPSAIDVKTGTIRSTSIPWFSKVLAALPDGTVFFARHRVFGTGNWVAAFRPQYPDDRVLLPVETLSSMPEVLRYLDCDSANGMWAILADGSLARLREGDCQVIRDAPRGDGVKAMLAGSRGDVVFVGRRFGYWRDGTTTWSPSIQELIAANREAIAASFSARAIQPLVAPTYSIAADQAGNVWLLDRQRAKLSVLIGETWVSADDALSQAGLSHRGIRYLSPSGGNSVYASDTGLPREGGRSYFASVQDRRIVFRTAPHTFSSGNPRDGILDRDGGLWLSGVLPAAYGNRVVGQGQLAFRVMDGNVDLTLSGAGCPALCDASGFLWLDLINDRPSNILNICQNGKVVSTVCIPGYIPSSNRPGLYSDRPGSVYAKTVQGITHLVAEPDKPAEYRIRSTYAIDSDDPFSAVAVTPDGLLIGHIRQSEERTSLGLVRLPKHDRGETRDSK